MTDQEIKDALLIVYSRICNDNFIDSTPQPVEVAVEKGLELFKNGKSGVKAESINGDIKVTYDKSSLMADPLISSVLSQYKKAGW